MRVHADPTAVHAGQKVSTRVLSGKGRTRRGGRPVRVLATTPIRLRDCLREETLAWAILIRRGCAIP
jgi:hypothetical protein